MIAVMSCLRYRHVLNKIKYGLPFLLLRITYNIEVNHNYTVFTLGKMRIVRDVLNYAQFFKRI